MAIHPDRRVCEPSSLCCLLVHVLLRSSKVCSLHPVKSMSSSSISPLDPTSSASSASSYIPTTKFVEQHMQVMTVLCIPTVKSFREVFARFSADASHSLRVDIVEDPPVFLTRSCVVPVYVHDVLEVGCKVIVLLRRVSDRPSLCSSVSFSGDVLHPF